MTSLCGKCAEPTLRIVNTMEILTKRGTWKRTNTICGVCGDNVETIEVKNNENFQVLDG